MRLFALPISDVETGRTPRYPDLQPLHLSVTPEKAFSAVSAVAGKMKKWTVVKVDLSARVLTAEARSRLWGFVDDVTIRVEAEGKGAAVHMRSRSRTGSFDRTAGVRRIRSFLKRVKEELVPGV
ncbi:MAG TPA: DUF1499 domain-containing protein [bacterium]|nr:DUF1499 domain-containing protein [bacterium]